MAIRKYAGDRVTLLSGDTKPLNMADGAICLETNTDTWFQLSGGTWVQITNPESAQNAADIITNTNSITGNTASINANAADLATHTGDTSNPHQVSLEQARTVLNQLNGDINFNDNSALNLNSLGFVSGETLNWNTDFKTLNVPTGLGPVLQVGQEFYFLLYNDTGVTIDNGQIVIPIGAQVVGSETIPTPLLAKADNFETCDGTLMMATNTALNGELFMATRLGRVSGINTTGFTEGDRLFLSDTVAGGITNVQPTFPSYDLRIGGVISVDASGTVGINFTKGADDTFIHAWDGAMRESMDVNISSNGTVITASVEQQGGGDLTMIFSTGFFKLDTTPAATIVLTPGTDTNPQANYVYIPADTKVLTVSTSSFPHGTEHIKVADLFLRSAATTQTDGALIERTWNDHVKTVGDNGHLLHITERMRQNPASWDDGAAGTCTVSSPTNSDVDISTTAGHVYQVHRQTFGVLDTSTGDEVHIVNDFSSPFKGVTNLNGETLDALGNTLGNKSFSFVLWGVQNSGTSPNHLMINKPTGSYAKNSPDSAVSDASNFSVYTIPKEFNGKGFLIARFTYTLSTNGLDWVLYDSEDLRGKVPNASAGGGGGGGAGATTFTELTDTPSSYVGQGGKIVKVAVGETALEFETFTGLTVSDIGVSVQGYDADTVIDAAYVHTDNNFTTAYKNEVDANTIKTGITTSQSAEIVVNNGKISYTDAAAVALNTAKTGITVSQSAEIVVNNAKTGITESQAAEIVVNNAKIGASASATNQGNTFNGASQLVELNGSGQYPALDGSLITNLPASGEINTINSIVTGEPTGSDVILNTVSLTQAEYDAGPISATTQYVITDAPSSELAPEANTGTVIDLGNYTGNFMNMSSANAATTYTTSGQTLGGHAVVRINAASEPTITGATKITGSDFIISTDMHMIVQYFGVTTQFFFVKLAI